LDGERLLPPRRVHRQDDETLRPPGHRADPAGRRAPGGVKVADTTTKIKIVREAPDGRTISLQVGPTVRWPTYSQVRSTSAVTPWRVAADRV
jgi:hypothetical protein